jgi:hypothetical protein
VKQRLRQYVLARLNETSTFVGLVLLMSGVVGFELSAADTAAGSIALGNLLAGALFAALPDYMK